MTAGVTPSPNSPWNLTWLARCVGRQSAQHVRCQLAFATLVNSYIAVVSRPVAAKERRVGRLSLIVLWQIGRITRRFSQKIVDDYEGFKEGQGYSGTQEVEVEESVKQARRLQPHASGKMEEEDGEEEEEEDGDEEDGKSETKEEVRPRTAGGDARFLQCLEQSSACVGLWARVAVSRAKEGRSFSFMAYPHQVQQLGLCEADDLTQGRIEKGNGETRGRFDELSVVVRTLLVLLKAAQRVRNAQLEAVAVHGIATVLNTGDSAACHALMQCEGVPPLIAACARPADPPIAGENCSIHVGAVAALCALSMADASPQAALAQGDTSSQSEEVLYHGTDGPRYHSIPFHRRLADLGCISAVLHVVLRDESRGPARMQLRHCMAAAVMYMSREAEHIELSKSDTRGLVALAKGCPNDFEDGTALEYTALSLWSFSRNAANRTIIGASGIFPVIVHLMRHWGFPRLVSDGNQHAQAGLLWKRKFADGWDSDALARIVKYKRVLGHLLAAVWNLGYCRSNRAELVKDVVVAKLPGTDSVLRLVVETLALPQSHTGTDLQRLYAIGLRVAWILCADETTALRMMELGLGCALLGSSAHVATQVAAVMQAACKFRSCFRIFAKVAGIMASHDQDGAKTFEKDLRRTRNLADVLDSDDEADADAAAAAAASAVVGRIKPDLYLVEKTTMTLARMRAPDAQMYGCLSIARACIEEQQRNIYRELGAVDLMLYLVTRPTANQSGRCTRVAASRALLNLSCSSANQIIICRDGLYDLLELSWQDVEIELQVNIAAIMTNLCAQPANRSIMYRAELHVKAEKTKADMKRRHAKKNAQKGGTSTHSPSDEETGSPVDRRTSPPTSPASDGDGQEAKVGRPGNNSTVRAYGAWLEELSFAKDVEHATELNALTAVKLLGAERQTPEQEERLQHSVEQGKKDRARARQNFLLPRLVVDTESENPAMTSAQIRQSRSRRVLTSEATTLHFYTPPSPSRKRISVTVSSRKPAVSPMKLPSMHLSSSVGSLGASKLQGGASPPPQSPALGASMLEKIQAMPPLNSKSDFKRSMNSKVDNLWSKTQSRNGENGRRRGTVSKLINEASVQAHTSLVVDPCVWVRCSAANCPIKAARHYTAPLSQSDLELAQTCFSDHGQWVNKAAAVHHIQTPPSHGLHSVIILDDPFPTKPRMISQILTTWPTRQPTLSRLPEAFPTRLPHQVPAAKEADASRIPLPRLVLRMDRDDAAPPEVVGPPFDLPDEEKKDRGYESWIFAPRLKQADARSYYDDEECRDAMFALDWERASTTTKFQKVLAKAMKLKATGKLSQDTVDAVTPICPRLHGVIREHYDWLQLSYEFYSVMGTSTDLSTLQKNQFNDFLGDANVLGKTLKRRETDMIFAAANAEDANDAAVADANDDAADAKAGMNDANPDNALTRYEFIEIVVRLGIAKFCNPKKAATEDQIVDAVDRVLTEHFALNTGEGSCTCEIHDKSKWRRENLYTKEIDQVLGDNIAALKAVFNCFQGAKLRNQKKDQMPLTNFITMLVRQSRIPVGGGGECAYSTMLHVRGECSLTTNSAFPSLTRFGLFLRRAR